MSTKLRILVPVKRVIDYAIKPRINKTRTGVETAGVKHSMNPFDELSVEEAVRIREQSRGPPVEDILVMTAGPTKSADTLRTAMAMGADRALHIEMPESRPDGGSADPEPLTVAKLVAEIARQEKSNLIVLGKQSIDDDAHQTGQMVAALLGWPQATQASKVEFSTAGESQTKLPPRLEGEVGAEDKDVVTVTREIDGGSQTIRARLPMVVTTDLRLNEPRYASLPNIMKAKRKPLVKKKLEDYGLTDDRRLQVLQVVEPPARQGGTKVDNVDDMIAKLKELGAI